MNYKSVRNPISVFDLSRYSCKTTVAGSLMLGWLSVEIIGKADSAEHFLMHFIHSDVLECKTKVDYTLTEKQLKKYVRKALVRKVKRCIMSHMQSAVQFLKQLKR